MPFLSSHARRRKITYFLKPIPKAAHILEIGSGDGWVGDFLRTNGWRHYVSLDLVPPADVVGDIREWHALGLAPASFDAIIAFEIVEHVDCFQSCYELLKDQGKLLVTTPVPHMDWFLRTLEYVGLNQRRTSPHNHLVDLHSVDWFEEKDIRIVAGLSQWGILTKSIALRKRRGV